MPLNQKTDQVRGRSRSVCAIAWLLVLTAAVAPECALSQNPPPQNAIPSVNAAGEEETSPPLNEVDVTPAADDREIAARLRRILSATDWFEDAGVMVDEGVVFLDGVTVNAERKQWAGGLARNTQDVVAVVNRIEVRPDSLWDFGPAWGEIRVLARESVQAAPMILVGIVLLAFTWLAAKLVMRLASVVLQRRMRGMLLRQVVVRAVAVPVFLLGLYLVLRIAGLTQMAVTVVGGTGLLGLVVGIAFRDIAENFLASILISAQRPFRAGDLVEVDGHRGFIESVTTRGTLLMTLEGNHVQIPNATIYKSTIINYTANPKLRLDFVIGIDYGDSVSEAQDVALRVLRQHSAVLDEPEPLVLVEELGSSTVNLRVQFWIDGHKYSQYKVRSSMVRLTKLAIEEAGLTMPDESREVIFPKGVPVRLRQEEADARDAPPPEPNPAVAESAEDRQASLPAEGGLRSERHEIAEQARTSRRPDDSIDLLTEHGTD